MAEKSLGLSSLPVGKRGKAPTRPTASPGSNNTPRAAAPIPRAEPARVAQVVSRMERPSPAIVASQPPATTPTIALLPGVSGMSWEPFTGTPLPLAEKRIKLDQMDQGEVRVCTACRLCETRTNTVFGVGDPDAKLMFIGEGPGENEDLQGKPFVGRAGELLDKQITAMGLTRDQVFICNIVKCRPPENRQPLPDETAACTPFLMRQIEIIRPSVIVTLGLPATQFLLQKKEAMSRMRGKWHDWRGIGVMPTYHPAYLLRNYTPEVRRMVWADLQMVIQRLSQTSTR